MEAQQNTASVETADGKVTVTVPVTVNITPQVTASVATDPPKIEVDAGMALTEKVDRIQRAFNAEDKFNEVKKDTYSCGTYTVPLYGVKEIFDDRIFACDYENGGYVSIPYEMAADGAVTFGEPKAAMMSFEEIEAAAAMTVQSLVFKKKKFTAEEAKTWAEKHEFHSGKMDETKNTYRFRQFSPTECQSGSYASKELTDGVMATMCKRSASVSASRLIWGMADEIEIEAADRDNKRYFSACIFPLDCLSDHPPKGSDLPIYVPRPIAEKYLDSFKGMPINAKLDFGGHHKESNVGVITGWKIRGGDPIAKKGGDAIVEGHLFSKNMPDIVDAIAELKNSLGTSFEGSVGFDETTIGDREAALVNYLQGTGMAVLDKNSAAFGGKTYLVAAERVKVREEDIMEEKVLNERFDKLEKTLTDGFGQMTTAFSELGKGFTAAVEAMKTTLEVAKPAVNAAKVEPDENTKKIQVLEAELAELKAKAAAGPKDIAAGRATVDVVEKQPITDTADPKLELEKVNAKVAEINASTSMNPIERGRRLRELFGEKVKLHQQLGRKAA